jgi:hypothetical protein
MKKWLLLLVVLIFFSILAFYLILPSTIQVTQAVKLVCSPASAARGLLQESKWPKWLNSRSENKLSTSDKSDTFSYSVNAKLNKELLVDIERKNQKWSSRLYILPDILDSVSLKWQCKLEAGINPLSRWKQYRVATALQQDMHRVLDNLKSVLENSEDLYGFPIFRTRVTDTILIATRASFKKVPSTDELYKMIANLRQYIKMEGATETGFPMVHYDQLDSLNTETMVAIPINKPLPDKGKFIHKRMVSGYILVAEVKGGPATIRIAFDEMEKYISDNQKQKIAISFESLITDRLVTKDTSSWRTKVYFPIVK